MNCRWQFGLRAVLTYSDGTTEAHYVPFCPDLDVWQFVSTAIVPKQPTKTVSKIRVLAVYEGNANTAYFDNLSLIREVAQTMKYDENGNLVSVTTTGLKEETNTYDKGNLIKTVTGGYGTYTYRYDGKHNLTSVTDGTVTQTMTYSGAGNVTKTTLTGGNLTLESSAAYEAGGNRLTSVKEFRLANHIDRTHIKRTYLNEEIPYFFAIETSVTITELEPNSQDDPAMFYSYSDFGIETSLRAREASFGLGAHLGDWFGIETEINATSISISNTFRLTPFFHYGGSISKNGIGFNVGLDYEETSKNFDVTIGWPTIGIILFFMGVPNPLLGGFPQFGG